MTLDDVLRIAEAYGPAALSVVGAALTLVGGGILGALRWMWKTHNRRMADMTKALSEFGKAIKEYEESNHEDHRKVWDKLKEVSLRAEALKDTVAEMKGGLAVQVGRVDTYIERMGKVDALMVAVLRFVDKVDPTAIPKRATDG